MGKKGEGARNKVRASSSSLAASLSQGSGSLTAGFGGYVGGTKIDNGPNDDAYLNIDAESAANLRRLSKKDSTTKLKALVALTEFFQEHSAAEVSALLTFWVYEYKKLVQDNNRQVREATHKAMSFLATTVGRSLAPHLRSLMGAWWMSHFDPFYEVSTAAKQAFEVAFPGQKRLEALAYCANDIFTYIDENLKLTPQTISDKNVPLEESTEKHERVVASSLFALSGLIGILFTAPSSEKEKYVPAVLKLFKDHRMFQGLLKSGSPRIRSGVYEALKSYLQYVPEAIAGDTVESAAKLILGSFTEKDTACHQAMWDMILLFTRRFGEAWDTKKVVHQRFWAFLRHGCYGSQKISYPCLLPLLSIVPASALAPAHEFFADLLSNLWKGREEVVFPKEDGMLLLKVVRECFVWVIQHEEKYSSVEGFEKGFLQKTLAETGLLGLIWQTYMHDDSEDKFLLLRSEIGTCIVDILESLESHVLTSFWTSLREDCSASLLMNGSHKNARMHQFLIKLNLGISSEDKRAMILGSLVKPFVAEGFPFVKQMEEPESLKLFTGLVSSYGSRVFDLLASLSWKGEKYVEFTQECVDSTPAVEEVSVSNQLLYFFRNELLPWCITKSNDLKIEMLLTFLEEQTFFKEWEYVLTFLLQSKDAVSSLERITRTLHQRCPHNELQTWRSPQVENKILDVVAGDQLFDPSCYALIRTTIAGLRNEGTYLFIVSEDTLVEVVNALLKAAISVVHLSKNQTAALLAESICPWSFEALEPSTFENAKAAVSILLSSFESFAFLEGALCRFCATVLCLYWAFVPEVEDDNESEDEEEGVTSTLEDERSLFTSTLSQAHRSVESMCRMLSSHCQVQELVIRGVNKVVSKGVDTEYADRWVLDCIKLTCSSPADVQRSLDILLASTDYWPLWTAPSPSRESLAVQKHKNLSAIVYKVGCALGPVTLFLGGDEVSRTRPWLIVELLCAWEFRGASARDLVLPFLQDCAREGIGSSHSEVLASVLDVLFHETARGVAATTDDPYLRALLAVLRALFVNNGPLGRKEGEKMFVDYIAGTESAPALPLKVLPRVLEVLMPTLIKGAAESTYSSDVELSICLWLKLALHAPSFYSSPSSDDIQWMPVVVTFFPIETTGGAAALHAASKADVSQTRKNMLLFLLRKQVYALKDTNFEGQLEGPVQLMLARLIVAAVAYCWRSFGLEEWTFIVTQLKEWIEHGVLRAEEFTEAVAESMLETRDVEKSNCYDEISTSLLSTSLMSFSLMQALKSLEEATDSESYKALNEAHWPGFEGRAVEQVLRLFLASGLVESITSASDATRRRIAAQRLEESCLWDRVADIALSSSGRVREAAVRAVDLWGVGKSGISALYSILFSPHPVSSLQWVSCNFLSTHPLQHQAITWKTVSSGVAEGDQSDADFPPDPVYDDIRPELLDILGTSASRLYDALSSTRQAHYFLAWSILLSHLLTLETTSPARERLLQYVKDTDISSTLLDCLLQHIPLRKVTGEKKFTLESSPAADAAKRSASTGSVFFAAEALLWGGDNVKNMEVIAGALFGLMLKVLPACVQTWFIGLKDRGAVAAIEAFTTENCSPHLLNEEFNQVQASAISDTNMLIKANRSTREVTATYKTEEAGMDIVIKMPACYPLKPVEMECTRKLGISETRLRKWMLSMAAFLRNQNGCLSEAVLIWKRNIDREFEGVEDCPICYSIIHTVNHTLPRLACKTCRHKFHGACLYKWFSTSHKSTCPLCQTPF